MRVEEQGRGRIATLKIEFDQLDLTVKNVHGSVKKQEGLIVGGGRAGEEGDRGRRLSRVS